MEVQLALVKLIEECAEVQHAATKCIRFGCNTTWEGYGNNKDVLLQEVTDLQNAINRVTFFWPAIEANNPNHTL